MTDLNAEKKTGARFATDDQQTPSKFSNGIGGLLKRISPKYRSRSKSPAAHSQQKIEKSWVTVEIKDYHQTPSPVGASAMGNYASSSSSPSSPILRNGGSTSPDKSPRLRGAWGNLFHRGSMKKPRDPSAQKAAKIEARTRSEHELDGENGIRMTGAHSTDLAGGRLANALTIPMNTAQRLTRENGGDIRDGYGALTTSVASRGTLSEEDLVSKSLSRERGDVYKPIIARGTAAGVQSSVPASLTAATTYHSQDSVFDSPSRMPSYVRISCTLSGYRNYRNVDLKAAQSPRQVRPPSKGEPIPGTTIGQSTAVVTAPPIIPIGKSIVERRLEKFEHISPGRNVPAAASATSPKEQHVDTAGMTTTDNAGTVTPTPIKDLISNFNKMSIHDPNSPLVSRPRQKPPPIPPKRDRLVEKFEHAENESKELLDEHKFNTLSAVEMNGLKTNIQNGSHYGNDAIFDSFPESTMVERIVNGAFHREPIEECVTTIVAQRAAHAAVEEAMKHVSASIVQSRQPHPHEEDGELEPFMCQQLPTADGRQLEKIVLTETTLTTSEHVGSSVKETAANQDRVEMTTMDGLYYQTEAAKERERLEKLCAGAEIYLNSEGIPDEALERIRMAVGRVRLLLGKKFAKFEELIQNNLNPKPDDPRPTHVSDLEGYYDLVKMEIEDIDACFDVVRRLKENNWQLIGDKNDEDKNQSKPNGQRAPAVTKPKKPAAQTKTNVNARSEAAKQRLKEAKEAAMQRKKQAQMDDGSPIDQTENMS